MKLILREQSKKTYLSAENTLNTQIGSIAVDRIFDNKRYEFNEKIYTGLERIINRIRVCFCDWFNVALYHFFYFRW